MMTRQSVPEDSVDDEAVINALKDANVYEPGLTHAERLSLYRAVMESNEDQQRHSGAHGHLTVHGAAHPSAPRSAEGGTRTKRSSLGLKQPDATSVITDDESSSEMMDDMKAVIEKLPQCSVSLIHCERPSQPGNSTSKPIQKACGRGRGSVRKPSMLVNPGTSMNTQNARAEQQPYRASQHKKSPESSSDASDVECLQFVSTSEKQLNTVRKPFEEPDSFDKLLENEKNLIPLIEKEEDKDDISTSEDKKAKMSRGDATEVPAPDTGGLMIAESPLASLAKKCQTTKCPAYFLTFKKGCREAWLKEARAAALKLQSERWEQLRKTSGSEWEIVTDISKVPSPYSSFFDELPSRPTTHGRQAKIAAMSKMNQDLEQDSEPNFEQSFQSLRKSARQAQNVDNESGRPNPWTPRQSVFQSRNQDEFAAGSIQGSSNDDENNKSWATLKQNVNQHSKPDTKNAQAESDSDSAPASPAVEASSRLVPQDQYDLIEDTHWQAAKTKRNRRASKAGDPDWEQPTSKLSLRGKGKKSRGNRVARGALCRPQADPQGHSQVYQPEAPDESSNQSHDDIFGDTTKWRNRDYVKPKQESNTEISPGRFFPPRSIEKPTQKRFNNREREAGLGIGASNNSAHETDDNSDVKVVYESPHKAPETSIPCPICNERFPEKEIADHASDCMKFVSPGQAE